jgi:hypothetical protein
MKQLVRLYSSLVCSSAVTAVQKPDVVHQENITDPNCQFPEWVDFEPLADFRLIARESDESSVEVMLTSEEYRILKDHLARMRGYVARQGAHAAAEAGLG